MSENLKPKVLILVNCVKEKLPRGSKDIAKELYISDFFKKARYVVELTKPSSQINAAVMTSGLLRQTSLNV